MNKFSFVLYTNMTAMQTTNSGKQEDFGGPLFDLVGNRSRMWRVRPDDTGKEDHLFGRELSESSSS